MCRGASVMARIGVGEGDDSKGRMAVKRNGAGGFVQAMGWSCKLWA